MSIKDIEKINLRQMDMLKKNQARETARLEQGHENLKTELKKSQAAELVDLKDEHSRQVEGEAEKTEKVFAQMKSHLEETKKLTDKQIKDLKADVTRLSAQERERLSLELDRTKTNHELYMSDLNYRSANEVKRVSDSGQEQLRAMNQNKLEELQASEQHFDGKLQAQTSDFRNRFQGDAIKYQSMKSDQDRQFRQERLNTNLRQQVELGKLTTGHSNHLEAKDQNFRKGMKEQDLSFEQKYTEHLQKKNDDFKRLDQLHDKVINKMKGDLTHKLEYQVNRSDDPFYEFTELKPTLKTYEDRVEISVEIPDHSKQDVQLTTNGKEAIVTFNRRYDDIRKEGNTQNKIHKVESFTTRLATEHVLNPKSVKSNFDNGVMTYVVMKA